MSQFPLRSQHAELYKFYRWEVRRINQTGIDSRRFDSEVEISPWLPSLWLGWHYGLGRADRVAEALGHDLHSQNRAKAGIMMQLREIERLEGHCWEDWEIVKKKTVKLLSLEQLAENKQNTLLSGAMRSLVDEEDCQHIKLPSSNRAPLIHAVARSELARMEEFIAKVFLVSRRRPKFYSKRRQIIRLARNLSIKHNLNESQQKAIETALTYHISIISGVAGSGKSYVISVLHKLHQSKKRNVILCAPTGKAARRLEEVTEATASTVHRLLGYNGYEYRRDASDPLDADVVIVDEVSMMDTELLYRLFQAIDLDRTTVTLVGDDNQLPPVGPGYPLRDLLENDSDYKARLPEVMRQAGDLKKNCTDILNGKVAESIVGSNEISIWKVESDLSGIANLSSRILELFSGELESLGYDNMADVQLLIPTKKTDIGTNMMNVRLQQLLQKQKFNREIEFQDPDTPQFFPGDKVIQTRNNYELGNEGVMNGTIGRVFSVSTDSMQVEFSEEIISIDQELWKDVQLAYALTVHKTQGSEFPSVVLVIHPSQYYKLRHRNLFYTGVTRAQKSVFILGEEETIKECAKRVDTHKRQTLLPHYMLQTLPSTT